MTPPLSEDVIAQYNALLSGGGAVDLSSWSQVEFTGDDRHSFLHNLCTNNINALKTGETCEAFISNVQGKTVGYGYFHCTESSLIYTTAPGQGEFVASHFDRYLIREKVTIADKTDVWTRWLVTGAFAGNESSVDMPLLAVAARLVMFTDKQDSIAGKATCSETAFDIARMECRTPVFSRDVTDGNLPQEVDRNEQAISFTKGCYLGQETVARLDALGHVNRTLCLMKFVEDTVPDPGTTIEFEGNVIATVTSSVWSPKHAAPIALGYVRRGHGKIGQRIEGSRVFEVIA